MVYEISPIKRIWRVKSAAQKPRDPSQRSYYMYEIPARSRVQLAARLTTINFLLQNILHVISLNEEQHS